MYNITEYYANFIIFRNRGCCRDRFADRIYEPEASSKNYDLFVSFLVNWIAYSGSSGLSFTKLEGPGACQCRNGYTLFMLLVVSLLKDQGLSLLTPDISIH